MIDVSSALMSQSFAAISGSYVIDGLFRRLVPTKYAPVVLETDESPARKTGPRAPTRTAHDETKKL